ncbi:RHS repeat domain-containing protein [Flavobacterium oreochromis]|uniref:RHS repeat domain-containing protein n=2 Tax=Flavobacterium oreochromis TaxID=2906078 RepID=UPI00385F45F4
MNDLGEVYLSQKEAVDDLVTWIYQERTFVPSAKIQGEEQFSIISDYLGRPVQSYDQQGRLVWQTDYDIYGKLRNLQGEKTFIPFRQLGQYEDPELDGLYYNRYRWYDCETGLYICQDPIGLLGNNPTFYGYVYDSNTETDPFGLIIVYRALNGAQEASAKAGEAIQPKNINSTHTIQQHIDDGSLQTKYISTTKKKSTADFYGKPNPKRGKMNPSTIIAIDTDKINPSKVHDVSGGINPQTGKKLDMPALRYATKDAEVLIEGEIPKGAYKIVCH